MHRTMSGNLRGETICTERNLPVSELFAKTAHIFSADFYCGVMNLLLLKIIVLIFSGLLDFQMLLFIAPLWPRKVLEAVIMQTVNIQV